MLSFEVFSFLLLISILFTYAEKVCPSYGNAGFQDLYSCFDQCSPDDDQCGLNKKCCFFLTHPCGHRCIIPKDNTVKSGECPSPNYNLINILWITCDIRLCDVDNDCPDDEKCCSNKCNTRLCLTPEKSKRKKRLFDIFKNFIK
jgi:hypothetical protein